MNGTGHEPTPKTASLPELIFIFFIFTAVISSVVGICIAIWQVYSWMKVGVWTPIPTSIILMKLGVNLDSVYYPQSWLGLAKVVQWVLKKPASLCIPITSYILFVINLYVSDYIDNKR